MWWNLSQLLIIGSTFLTGVILDPINLGQYILIIVCVNSCILELCCTKPEKTHVTA